MGSRGLLLPFLVCVTAGAIYSLALPPHGQAWLAWIALVPLCLALRARSFGPSLLLGLAFGLGMVGCTVPWFLENLREVYGLTSKRAMAGWFVIGGIFISTFGVFGVWNWLLDRAWLPQPWCFPLAWCATEAARTEIAHDVPWMLLGHSQAYTHSVLQWAELGGENLVSLLLVLVNVWVAQALHAAWQRRWLGGFTWAGAALALCLTTFLLGGARFEAWEARTDQDLVRVAIVQAAIPHAERFQSPELRAQHLEQHLALTRQAVADGASLIVWPETSIENHLDSVEGLATSVAAALDHDPSKTLLAGAPRAVGEGQDKIFFNSVVAFDGSGAQRGLYDKIDLVPISETVPWWIRRLPGMERVFSSMLYWEPYTAGSDPSPLTFGPLRAAILICFESILPDRTLDSVRSGANVLFNLSNDAVLVGNGVDQQFAMTVFRSVENRRPLLRASNRGVGGVVETSGRVRQQLGVDETGFAVFEIGTQNAQTHFQLWGHKLPETFMWLGILGTLRGRRAA